MAFIIIAVENNLTFAFTQGDPNSGFHRYSFTSDFENQHIAKFDSIDDAESTRRKYLPDDTDNCKYEVIPEISNYTLISLRNSFEVSSKNVIHAMTSDANGYNREYIRKQLGNHMKQVQRLIEEMGR